MRKGKRKSKKGKDEEVNEQEGKGGNVVPGTTRGKKHREAQ